MCMCLSTCLSVHCSVFSIYNTNLVNLTTTKTTKNNALVDRKASYIYLHTHHTKCRSKRHFFVFHTVKWKFVTSFSVFLWKRAQNIEDLYMWCMHTYGKWQLANVKKRESVDTYMTAKKRRRNRRSEGKKIINVVYLDGAIPKLVTKSYKNLRYAETLKQKDKRKRVRIFFQRKFFGSKKCFSQFFHS